MYNDLFVTMQQRQQLVDGFKCDYVVPKENCHSFTKIIV